LTLSSPARIEHWHVALEAWRAHRVLGLGAGTYAQYSMQVDSYGEKVLDAHNLYLETLAELGLVGLVILGAALAVPLAGAVRGRHSPLVTVGGGAYATWLVHAAYDWDWELPAVTLAALLCAGAVVAGNRRLSQGIPPPVRAVTVAAVVVVGVVGAIGLLGNRALSASSDAAARHDYSAAVSQARRARTLAPWSSQPWLQLANIRLQQGRSREAVEAYRRALAKDPDDWTIWVGLAGITTGAEHAHALGRLRVLAPAVAAAFVPRKSRS
jgi:cytochrome c-type biogenesis protein CcmH/NrfG